MFIEGLAAFPDGNSTFLLLFGSAVKEVPDPLNGVIFDIVLVEFHLLVFLPCVENSRFNLVICKLIAQILVLVLSIKWLETVIVPCVQGLFHLVVTQLQSHDRK